MIRKKMLHTWEDTWSEESLWRHALKKANFQHATGRRFWQPATNIISDQSILDHFRLCNTNPMNLCLHSCNSFLIFRIIRHLSYLPILATKAENNSCESYSWHMDTCMLSFHSSADWVHLFSCVRRGSWNAFKKNKTKNQKKKRKMVFPNVVPKQYTVPFSEIHLG